jgi:hypothetical protein
MDKELKTSLQNHKLIIEWARISFAIVAVALASFLTQPAQNDFSLNHSPNLSPDHRSLDYRSSLPTAETAVLSGLSPEETLVSSRLGQDKKEIVFVGEIKALGKQLAKTK